jgi:hypothetical protein
MFPYDPAILAALQNTPQTISDVLAGLQTIDGLCVDGDGLKWFNGLYLAVTQAVENRVNCGGFSNPAWLSQLDVQFARLYFSAVRSALTGAPCPGCWAAMFSVRDTEQITRIQFALAGMNAHINRDLCLAIDATCKATNTVPQHGTAQYNDYTSLNPTLDGLIDQAKQTLDVRLPGDPLPAVSHLEDPHRGLGRERSPRNGLEERRAVMEHVTATRVRPDGHHRRIHRCRQQSSAGALALVAPRSCLDRSSRRDRSTLPPRTVSGPLNAPKTTR